MDDLPLLHKYVLNPDDDLQLQMTKLRYRLCVKEVGDVIERRSRIFEVEEEAIMADTVFEVQNSGSGLGPEGPQCMSSPLQSPTDDKTGHLTMKSDDSGIMMDESTFSMNESVDMTSSDVSSPEMEDKPLTNGHRSSDEEDQKPTGTEISDLIAAMEGEGKVTPVPEITIDRVDSQEEDVEDEQEGTQVVEDKQEVGESKSEEAVEEAKSEEVEEVKSEEVKESKSEVVESQTVVEESKTEVEESKTEVEESKPDEEAEPKQEEVEESKTEEGAQVEDEVKESSEETKPSEEETQQSEEEEEEEEEESEEEEEDDRVDFVKDKETLKEFGTRCDDVYKALEILNTRYRLSGPPVRKPRKPTRTSPTYHTLPRAKTKSKPVVPRKEEETDSNTINRKSIITWSCWNITDMVHPMSDRTSWWAKQAEQEPEQDENANIKDLNQSIGTKADEIDALVAKVLENEKEKKEQEDRLKEPAKSEEPSSPAPVEEEELKPVEDAPIEAVAAPEEEQEKPKKKKKGNLFQRMVRSVRKRFGGNRTRA